MAKKTAKVADETPINGEEPVIQNLDVDPNDPRRRDYTHETTTLDDEEPAGDKPFKGHDA